MSCLSSTVAGSWYPGSADELRHMLDQYAERIPDADRHGPTPNILILPHAGYCYSAPTALCGIARIMGAGFHRVIVLAPSHRYGFRDRLVAPESSLVSTPFGAIPLDETALLTLKKGFPVDRSDAVHTEEHAAQIEYPLLQYALKEFRILPLIVSELSADGFRRAATALRRILDSETLLVISSDFTHYGTRFDYTPFRKNAVEEVKKLDLAAFEAIKAVNAEQFEALIRRTGATICGRSAIALLLHLAPSDTRFELLHYANSVGSTADAADFVCYLCAAGYASWPEAAAEKSSALLTEPEKHLLLSMARRSIEHALSTRRALPPDAFAAEATPVLNAPMGCFVTLHTRDSGDLRGCLGEIEPRLPLYQAVTELAIASAFRDPRFQPMTAAEWPNTKIEISILTPPRPVATWHDIVIGKHGMTLSKHGRSAVFLPQVAPEQNWDLPTTLTHLAMKAGLGPDDWREGAQFTVFEAVVCHEK